MITLLFFLAVGDVGNDIISYGASYVDSIAGVVSHRSVDELAGLTRMHGRFGRRKVYGEVRR